MDESQHKAASRRLLVKSGVCALTSLAMGSLMAPRAMAADTKLAKSVVQYVDVGKDEGKDCDDCMQFIPGKSPKAPGACKIVEGEINPHGHCIAFTPKLAK